MRNGPVAACGGMRPAAEKRRKVQLTQYVMRCFGQFRTLPDQLVAAAAQGTVDRTWNGEHLSAAARRLPSGDQGAASACRLDHQSPEAQGRNDAVPPRKILPPRRGPKRESADQGALLPDFEAQGAIAPRIDDVDPRSQHGERDSLRRECA